SASSARRSACSAADLAPTPTTIRFRYQAANSSSDACTSSRSPPRLSLRTRCSSSPPSNPPASRSRSAPPFPRPPPPSTSPAPRPFDRAHVQVAAQRADLVDPDLVADRLECVHVGVRVPEHALRLPEQLGGERARGRALAHAGRPVQEVRVRRALRERRPQEAL